MDRGPMTPTHITMKKSVKVEIDHLQLSYEIQYLRAIIDVRLSGQRHRSSIRRQLKIVHSFGNATHSMIYVTCVDRSDCELTESKAYK